MWLLRCRGEVVLTRRWWAMFVGGAEKTVCLTEVFSLALCPSARRVRGVFDNYQAT
jgi:hypothetical protein